MQKYILECADFGGIANAKNEYCCPSGCTQCGGKGCGRAGKSCCGGKITALCKDVQNAPCRWAPK